MNYTFNNLQKDFEKKTLIFENRFEKEMKVFSLILDRKITRIPSSKPGYVRRHAIADLSQSHV